MRKRYSIILVLLLLLMLGNADFLPGNPVLASSSSAGQRAAFVPRNAQETQFLNSGVYKYRIGDLWGLYNDRGILTYPQYTEIKKLDSMFAVKKYGYWGAVDTSGRVKIPIKWDSICALGMYYRVELNGSYGLVNDNGKMIFQPIYTDLAEVTPLLYSACKSSGCGLIKYNGDIIMPLTQEGILGGINGISYLFSIKKDNLYGIIDIYGNKVSDYRYYGINQGDHNVIYTTDSKYLGLAAANEDREILSSMFDNIDTLSQKGYYKVKTNGKWGVVSYEGKMIYPCEYGTFEINRMMNKYAEGNKFEETDNYNYYYSKILEAYFNLLFYGKDSSKTQKVLKEVMKDANKYPDLQQKAKELIQKYGIQI